MRRSSAGLVVGRSQVRALIVVACGATAIFGCSGTESTSTPTGVGGAGTAVGGSGVGGAAIGGSTAVNPGGGSPATGGATSTLAPSGGGQATGGAGTGGSTAAGGKSSSGGAATGGSTATGGKSSSGGAATGGSTASGGSTTTGGGSATGPDCSATMPTGGVVHNYTGSWATDNGSVAGLRWGMWSNGTGGSITVFPNTQAFSASWNNSEDFLAHLGLDISGTKTAAAYNSIVAQFAETKTGTAGGFSMVGMYGWTQSPCVEWYINEDSYHTMGGSGTTVTIDGGTYYIRTLQTTGTGGANACESGHTGPWTQMISTRQTKRQCGTITVSDHFKAWAAQGWSLGILKSVHINVETGGGVGTIQFPVATVTAN